MPSSNPYSKAYVVDISLYSSRERLTLKLLTQFKVEHIAIGFKADISVVHAGS